MEEEFISPDFRNRRDAVYEKKEELKTLKKPKKQKSITTFFKKLMPNLPTKSQKSREQASVELSNELPMFENKESAYEEEKDSHHFQLDSEDMREF